MRTRPIAQALLSMALGVCASQAVLTQQKPLTRTFVSGTEERYQVTASIRVETHGVSTEKIGEKTYVKPFTHEATGQVSWRAIRKITALSADGAAAITESLDQFRTDCGNTSPSAATVSALQKSVQDTCALWQSLSELKYEEEKFGLIRGLPQSAGDLTGPNSALLSLWLRRAFRPSVILPKTSLHFGDRAAHRISNPSGLNANAEGEESMEWLEASSDIPAATLHVSQNLGWIEHPMQQNISAGADNPNLRHLFFADSMSTVSLLDGSLLRASRSASHETKELLDPVPGMPDAPEFGSKLTITVTMLRLP